MLILALSVTLTTIMIVAARLRSGRRTADLGSMGDGWLAANQTSRS